MIITTKGMYWLLEGMGKGHINFKDLKPHSIRTKSSFPTDKIILSDFLVIEAAHFGAGSAQYSSFVTFLLNACRLVSPFSW